MEEELRSSVNGVHVGGEEELCRAIERVKGSSEEKNGGDDDGVVSNGIVGKANDLGSVMLNDSGRVDDSTISFPEGKIEEEMRECQPLGCGDNDTDVDSCDDGGDNGNNNTNDSGSVMLNDLGRAEDSTISFPEGKVEEEMRECDVDGHTNGGDNGTNNTNVDGHASGGAGQLGGVTTVRKRGRKRKNIEVLRLGDGTGEKLESVVLDAMTQVNGRVLRSRTMASANGVSVERVDGKTKDEIKQAEEKEMKVDEEEEETVQPRMRKRKRKKGRRGRPPKIDPGKVVSGVVGRKKKKAFGSKSKPEEKSNKLLDGAATEDSKSSEPCKSNANESKEDNGTGWREKKQLAREQIMEMVKRAGWTIDYRPRNGREYHDAVYVDLNGRTYWSITKAYKKLKKTVDNGVAAPQEAAAFAAIPDKVFSKLFRVAGKKRSDFGVKKGTGVTAKKLAQNKSQSRKIANSKSKSSSRKMVDSRSKEKSKLVPQSRGRKRKLNPEEGRKKKRYALLARGSESGSDPDGSGFVLYDGKRSLLSWMIDMGCIAQSAKVQYMTPRKTRVLLEGKITGDGIRCGCCSDVHTSLSFESHAGSKLGQPFKNIYLKSGRSLLDCLVDSWSIQEKIDKIEFCSVDVAGDDPNDDTCNICGDGGDLICCDGCPSTFHQSCLGIEHCPTGDWRCLYCLCKFCGTIGGKTSQDDDSHDDKSAAKLFTCHLCKEKFHISCMQGKDAPRTNPKAPLFCGEGCQKLFKGLGKLLGVRHELDEEFSWTILQLCDVGKGVSLGDDLLKVECNSKLAVAFSVMDECFLPIVDERSKSNMIHNVVYSCGSNFKRLNYSGFYTIILERGDEIVSAASVRIHGTQLAEMPFIATRYRYRRQGMCRRLLSSVETALRSLDVENLLIPAIPELIETWTKIFGFMPLEESKRRDMRCMSMIVFPGTDMLQKPLSKHQLTDEKMASATVGNEDCSLKTENEPKAADRAVNELLTASDSDPSADIRVGEVDETNAAAAGSGASLPDGTSSDTGREGTELRTEDVKPETCIVTGVNTRDDFKSEPTKEQCPDLNEPVPENDTITPEGSPAKVDPHDARLTGEEKRTGQRQNPSPPSAAPVSLHFGEKIVKCISKMLPQSSH